MFVSAIKVKGHTYVRIVESVMRPGSKYSTHKCVPSIRIPQFRQQKGPLGWGFLTLLKMGGTEAPGLIFLGEGRSPSPSRFRAAASRPNRPVGASRRYACAVQR